MVKIWDRNMIEFKIQYYNVTCKGCSSVTQNNKIKKNKENKKNRTKFSSF